MKHLTNKDKAVAEAHAQLKEAIASRNHAAVGRAFKAIKDAEAMTPLVECAPCGSEFEEGNDELVLGVATAHIRHRQADGSVVTEWLLEREMVSPKHIVICSDCVDVEALKELLNKR